MSGTCLRCGVRVPTGAGYFQRHYGRWVVRCKECVGKGNEPVTKPTTGGAGE